MHHYVGKQITVTSPELAHLQVDGDAVPLTRGAQVEFRIEPASLQVIVA